MTVKRDPILSRQAQAFNRLVAVVESKPLDEKTVQMSARMPLRLLQGIDRIAKHRGTSRTKVTVMLLEAVLAELAAEGGAQAKKLLGSEAQERRDSSKGRAVC